MSENYKTERNFILRLKQNTNIVTSGLEDAKRALINQMQSEEDLGQLIVCFYKDGNSNMRVIGGITGSETLLVNDYEITKEITDAITALKDGVTTDFDTLKKIEDYINSLDFETHDNNKGSFINVLEQTNGHISKAERVDFEDAVLTKYTKDNSALAATPVAVAKNDTLNTVISKLERQVDRERQDRLNAVNALDVPDSETIGKYVTHVPEEDGKISVQKKEFKDAQLTNYVKGTAPETLSVAAGDTLNAVVSKLEHQIDKEVADRKQVIDDLDATPTSGKATGEYGEHIKVDIVQTNGKLTNLTVTENNIESKTKSEERDEALDDRIDTVLTTKYTRNGYKFINSVQKSETEDKLLFTEEELNASKVKTTNIEGTTATIAVTGENVHNQIADMARTIKTNENKSEHYKLVKLSETEFNALITPASERANIKEAYRLMCWENGNAESTATQKGEIIKVYKDQHLKDVKLIGVPGTDGVQQILRFTYTIESGEEKIVDVDFSKLAFNAEFGDGLTVSDAGIISVLRDANSETDHNSNHFLTVSGTGVKVDHIKDEIDYKISLLDKTLTTTASEDSSLTNHVYVQVAQTDGLLSSLVVKEKNIANKSDLDTEIAARKAVDGQNGQTYTAKADANYIKTATSLHGADVILDQALKNEETARINAIEALDYTDTPEDGKYISQIKEENGVVSVVDRKYVSESKLYNYSKGTVSTAVAATDSVNSAISKLENQIDVVNSNRETAINALDKTLEENSVADSTITNHVKVKIVQTDGLLTSLEVKEKDIASAQALTNEISYRKAVDGQNGNTYVAKTDANYINTATSLTDADNKLDSAIKAINNWDTIDGGTF